MNDKPRRSIFKLIEIDLPFSIWRWLKPGICVHNLTQISPGEHKYDDANDDSKQETFFVKIKEK